MGWSWVGVVGLSRLVVAVVRGIVMVGVVLMGGVVRRLSYLFFFHPVHGTGMHRDRLYKEERDPQG